MQWLRTCGIAALAMSLAACGQGGLAQSGPTADELAQALNATNLSPVLESALNDCQSGKIGEMDVQVCGFCVVTVGIGRGENTWEEGAFLQAARHNGTVAFRRAFSADQPDVEPAAGQRGVWLAVGSTMDLGETSTTARFSNEQMQRVGYVRRSHLSAFLDSATTSVSREVADNLLADTATRQEVIGSVGSCSGAAPSAAPTPAPPSAAQSAAVIESAVAYQVVMMQARPFFYVENCSPDLLQTETALVQQAGLMLPDLMAGENLTITGPLTTVYDSRNADCIRTGYPFSGRVPRALLVGRTGELPSGRMLKIEFTGAQDQIDATVYRPMNDLIQRAGLDNVRITEDDWVSFEVYRDDATQAGGSRVRDIYYVAGDRDIAPLIALAPPRRG